MNITESNRRMAQQFHEAFNRGDLDAAASCFAEDCRNHGRQVGRAGVRKVLAEIKTNFPDARLTTQNSVVEGEWVVVRCTYSGTHRGTSNFPVDGGMLVGIQPTGRSFEVQHMHMYRVLDGKIAEHFANRDDVGMMRQLGLLPPLPSPPSRQGDRWVAQPIFSAAFGFEFRGHPPRRAPQVRQRFAAEISYDGYRNTKFGSNSTPCFLSRAWKSLGISFWRSLAVNTTWITFWAHV